MVTFIFIRHGESTDNHRGYWAGWKDASLTNHGMNASIGIDYSSNIITKMPRKQAKAVGAALSTIKLRAIHSSDLKRAIMTAEAIRDLQPDPKPRVYESTLLREQSYGSGEGKKWSSPRKPGLSLAEHYEQGIYPALRGRSERFPGGESLDELAERANAVINDTLLSYVWGEGGDEATVAVVSHGIFLSELVAAWVRRDSAIGMTSEGIEPRAFRGMKNTGWTKVIVTVKDAALNGCSEAGGSNPPSLQVRVVAINNCDHLLTVRRQRGGIGSSAFDPNQQDIRALFKEAAGTKPERSDPGQEPRGS